MISTSYIRAYKQYLKTNAFVHNGFINPTISFLCYFYSLLLISPQCIWFTVQLQIQVKSIFTTCFVIIELEAP